MEFPHLGKHCSKPDCKRLDFLPMKCDACSNIFCSDHITYAVHQCKESYKKDNQVPVCPLCNKPIPLMPGELADAKVGSHIDTDCQSDPAKERRKLYTNRCSHKGCKVKELIPVRCERCQRNFCLKHRFEKDHNCQGFEGTGQPGNRAGAAALSRLATQHSKPGGSGPSSRPLHQNPTPSASSTAAPQSLNEDEALALALQLSIQERGSSEQQQQRSSPASTADDADEQLARAIHESQIEERRRQQRQRTTRRDESRCSAS